MILSRFLALGGDFSYLRTTEGLSDGEINAIAQDSTGNMWFATWSGLICYDGVNFEFFRPQLGNERSLPEKKVKSVFVDSDDNLWITTSKYFCRFDKQFNSFVKIDFEDNVLGEVNIKQITEVDKKLLINSTEGLFVLSISRIDDKNNKAQKISVHTNESQIYDNFNYVFSFKNKLLLCDLYGTEPTSFYLAEITTGNADPFISLQTEVAFRGKINQAAYVEVENKLFLATAAGLVMFDVDNGFQQETIYEEGFNVEKVIYSDKHKIFFSGSLPELRFLDLHTGNIGSYQAGQPVEGALLNSNIHSLFVDFSDNLWVGHRGQGISILNLNRKEFRTFRKEFNKTKTLGSNIIMCFAQTDNELIIGCRTGGLNFIKTNKLDETTPDFDRIELPAPMVEQAESDGIWDIQQYNDSLFWVATSAGLYKLIRNNKKWKLEHFRGQPEIQGLLRKIYVDPNNNVWVGTLAEGLVFIPNIGQNPQGINYRYASVPGDSLSISDNTIISIFRDSKDRFWIGTQNGLNCLSSNYENYDLSGRSQPKLTFKRYFAKHASNHHLNNNEINDITENSDGRLWISTLGGGINVFDVEANTFEAFTTNDGLPGNDVLGCLKDEIGNFWISTTEGLSKYLWYAESSKFINYDHADGIQGDIFMVNSFFKAPDGQMFFGGDNGFSSFYPQRIQINNIPPKIKLSNLSIQNKTVSIGDTLSNGFVLKKALNYLTKLKIPFRSNTFKIGVSAIHFHDPAKNHIAYMLQGYNDKWTILPAKNGEIEFVNLPHGTYTLLAKGISSDNIESESIKSIEIEIQPPWYSTWYATFLFLIVMFSLLAALFFVFINRQKLVYQKRMDEMTIKNNEAKMNLLTNIAHDLRTPLSLVVAPLEDLMKNFNEEDKQWAGHFRLISRNANYLLRLVNQIVNFHKLNGGKLELNRQNVNIVQIVKDVVINFKGFDKQRNVHLKIEVPDHPVIMAVDVQKIEEILYNLLSNAFKNTYEKKSILVKVEKNIQKNRLETVRISVFNHGPEISLENQSKIFERFFKINDSDEGSGIGLSFTKSLVELHGGTIRVESIPGEGVVFSVDLPIEKIADQSSRAIMGSEINGSAKNFAGRKPVINGSSPGEQKKVVIVEDNPDLLDFLKQVLSRQFVCFTAPDGKAGWELIQNKLPALVISDVVMPKLDGILLTQLIKGNLETCHIPVILLTANSDATQVTSGYEVGADAYLTKPFDINILVAQAERLITNRDLIKEKYKTQNFMVEVESHASKDEDFVQAIRKILEENIADPEFNVNQLSKLMDISSTQLYRKLKGLTGYSPVEFIRTVKLQNAHNILRQRNHTVKEVCYITGFNNLSYFIKCFKDEFGVTPANFRDSGTQITKNEGIEPFT